MHAPVSKPTGRPSFSETTTLDRVELYPLRATDGVSPNMALGAMPSRPALLVRLTSSDGCFGWGEIWANFPPRANQHKAQLVEDVIAPKLTGMTLINPVDVTNKLRTALSTYFLHVGQSLVFEHILAGLDVALWDLALRQRGESFAQFMGLTSASVATYASSLNAKDAERLIEKHAGLGQSHFKIKIGFGSEQGLAFVRRAAEICPPDCHIMIDSNQSWNLDQAKTALGALQSLNPYFAEEPMRADESFADWQDLAQDCQVPLAGGENIYGVQRFLGFADAGVQYLQPDVAKWGGISGALELMDVLPARVNLWPHFMGTAVGQIAALCVTAVAGAEACCELDVNENRLRTELCGRILEIQQGRIKLPSAPGLVVPPEENCLMEFSEDG